jgi:hypothetical protein
MIRRAVLVAAAAVAFILAPSTAMAEYDASGFGSTVSDSTPGPGVPFTVHVSGAKANEAVTLTITRHPVSKSNGGAKSFTKTANASGVVDFAVTLTEDGTYALVSTSATGAVLGRQAVTVVAKGTVIVAGVGAAAGAAPRAAAGAAPRAAAGAAPRAAAGAAPRAAAGAAPRAAAGAAPRAAAGAAPVAAAGGQLSFTGFDGMGLAVGGGVLVLVGAGAILVTRRRTSELVPD